jgi:peptidoglycan hydrolase CwlO-like protein
MASEAYREKVNLKKEKQAEEVWDKISQIPKLAGLLDLHNKIKDLEKKRSKNREYMDDVDSNYKALKKNIKDFSKTQNTDKKKR